MNSTESNSLFSELSAEESAAVSGASHHCENRHSSRYRYHYPRRNHYEEEYSRRHNYSHYRGTIAHSVVVRYR